MLERLSPLPHSVSHSDPLEDGGERMVPHSSDAGCFWEHVYRYRFASQFVRGRRVLDIACGEGYGSAALLRAGATSVVGVDISAKACGHARSQYGVPVILGCAKSIPLASRSVDVVVSFETIEHIDTPELFLQECARVLTPGGILVVSTPNRDVYSETGHHNPFHCSELSIAEFASLLQSHLSECELYYQRPKRAPLWSRRSLAADYSPWFGLKGSWRLRVMLRSWLCPPLRGLRKNRVHPRFRRDVVETVLARDHAFDSLLNPYPVYQRPRWSNECPYYVIAVARA